MSAFAPERLGLEERELLAALLELLAIGAVTGSANAEALRTALKEALGIPE